MESLQSIRNRAAPTQPILDFIWNEWSKNAKWPRARVVDHKFGKEKSEHSLSALNDAYLLQCDPSHDPTYELRLFGVLSSSLGDQWLNMLSSSLNRTWS